MFRKMISIVIALTLIMSVFVVLTSEISATELSIASEGAELDIAETGNPYDRYATNPNGYWANCTYWAWQYAYEYDGVALPGWGHGGTWYASAQRAGYNCDKTPSAHSIMCTGSGIYGHVAYVTDYNSATGQVYIKQGGWMYSTDGRDERWVTAYPSDLQGYIHLSNPVSGAWLKIKNNSIEQGQSVTLEYGANNANGRYTIGIDKGNTRIHTIDVNTTSYSYTLNEIGDYSAYITAYGGGTLSDSNRVYFTVNPKGHTLIESEGAGRTIPDGDYWICSKIAQDFFIDLPGDNIVTEDGANVSTWTWKDTPGKYDVFHIEYLNNGFYRISQLNSNMSMDIEYGSLYRDANIHMWTKHDGVSQQWSIEGSDRGYKIRSRCNSFYMDIDKGTHEGGTNVHVWENHNGDWQFFSFIPYCPNERPLSDGVYTIDSSVGTTCNLDVSSVPGDYVENSNVQIWNNSYEQFQIEYAGDGYYRLYEATSKLAVEILNDNTSYLDNNKNVRLNKKNNTREQYWMIKLNSDGTCCFINKLSGYCLDVFEGNSVDGTNVHAHPYNGTKAQLWKPRRIIVEDMVTVSDVSITCDITDVDPIVSLKVDNTVLTKDTDYSVRVEADIAKGKGTVELTGEGNYCGTVTKEFSITVITSTEPSIIKLGDVDGDSTIEVRDATWIQRHVGKVEMPFVINKTTADVDGDGIITVMDATAIQYYLANIKNLYHIGGTI